MRRTQQHICAAFFCFLLVLPLLSIIGLQLLQLHIQHEATERLEREHLQTVVVVPEKLQWEKKDREALIEGKLFDVKSIHLQNGNLILTGLFDEQETALKKIIAGRNSTSFSIIQLLLIGQCFASLIFCINIPALQKRIQKLLTLYKEYPVQLSLSIPGPPPKTA